MSWISPEPTRQNLKMVRGDDASFGVVHTFGASSNVEEVRFYVRNRPEGDIVLALTLSANAGRFDLTTSNQCTISIEPADTEGLVTGRHWYDVELEQTSGAGGDVVTFQRGFFELKPDIANDGGGGALAGLLDRALINWVESGAYELTSRTPDGTYPLVIASGVVKWADGSAGAFTATSINATWEAVDGYTVTHTNSGKTVTQAAVTRDSNGFITAKPALVVS